MKHEQKFIWLDLVRGFSAIAVCASHLRNATLSDYGDVTAPTIIHKAFYLLTGLGHEAVMVFFVLSGMFVGGSVLKSGTGFRFADYVAARLTRLWIVLIPALFLTLLADEIIAAKAPEVLEGAYNALWNSGPSQGLGYSASLLTFLGNIFFMQTIYVPVFGTNGPLWSLANEFWYYVLFPLLALVAGQVMMKNRVGIRLLAVSAITGILVLLTESIRMGFFVWLLGVGVYLASGKLESKCRPGWFLFSGLLFAASLLYSKSTALQAVMGLHSDIVVGSAFSVFCIVIAKLPPPAETGFGGIVTAFSKKISDFSYSLYLSHFPIVILIAVFAYGCEKVQPTVLQSMAFFGWLGLLLSIGLLFWWAFERHTAIFRKLVLRRGA